MTAPDRTEHEVAVADIAQKYRNDGYAVLVEPSDDALPPILRGFRPDLVASRDMENIVVEVKLRRSPYRDWSELIRRVQSLPGWTFVFAVPPERDGDRATNVEIATEERIRRGLDEPLRLYDGGQPVASLLLGWSLFESAAQRRLATSGDGPPRGVTPRAVVTRLVYLGFLSQGDLRTLTGVIELRNRAAHGGIDVPVPREALERLRDATSVLLTSERAA